MMKVLGSVFIFFALTTGTFAATHDFTIRVQYGEDTLAPTTPGPLSATVISDDQINLSWGASTDNFSLGGYQVFRDAVQIATTTLTTYSDTNLTASTTYAYNIIAFDASFNFSTSSNFVSTTTFEIVVPPPPPPPEGGSGTPEVELVSLVIEPDFNLALLTWETSRYARYSLRWGETQSYELGYMTNQVYQKDHQTSITELEPNTTYEYELIAYDRNGGRTILSQGQFKTLAQPDVTPPPNVSRLRAEADDGNAVLTWENPEQDFAYVRIVRNPFFFPTDANDGYVVYQGTDERFIDRDAFITHNPLYYTVFAYDPAGNRSSGATAFVQSREVGSRPTVIDEPPEEEIPTTTIPIQDPLTISLEDITIIQSGEVIESVSGTYLVDTTLPFTISAPYDVFPEHLKAIQITIYHPVDENVSYSYLLRINSDKTAYEAVIDNLDFSGTIPLRLAVYDYQTEESAIARGSIIAKNLEPAIEVIKNIGPWYAQWWWVSAILMLLIVWFLLGRRRRDKDEDNPPVRFA